MNIVLRVTKISSQLNVFRIILITLLSITYSFLTFYSENLTCLMNNNDSFWRFWFIISNQKSTFLKLTNFNSRSLQYFLVKENLLLKK